MKKKFNEIRVINVVGKYLATYQGNGKWDMTSGEFSDAHFEFVYKRHKDSVVDWFRDRQWIMKSTIADKKDDICYPMSMSQFLECLEQTEISDTNIILFDNYKASNAHNTVPYATGKAISYEQLMQIAKDKYTKELESRMTDAYKANCVATSEEPSK